MAGLGASLTGHRMLPRITQSSNSAALGRESQIEPWLAVGQHAACRRKRVRTERQPMLPQTDSRSGTATCRPCRGAGCQKKPSSKKEGEVFFLDIPFYRTQIFLPRSSYGVNLLIRVSQLPRE